MNTKKQQPISNYDNVLISKLETYTPIGYVNIGLPRRKPKHIRKAKNRKKNKILSAIPTFDVIFDSTLNPGGKLTYSQMANIYIYIKD